MKLHSLVMDVDVHFHPDYLKNRINDLSRALFSLKRIELIQICIKRDRRLKVLQTRKTGSWVKWNAASGFTERVKPGSY